MSSFILAPSILSADFTRLGEQIQEAAAAGVDWIHVDVIDGQFAPNITMGPVVVEACRRVTDLPIDVHLMIETPDRMIDAFAQAGASLMSIHIENNPHIHRTLNAIRALGCKAGVVINPGTAASSLTAVLPFVDYVLVMSVNPGFSGQKFIPQTSAKIGEIRRMLDDLNPTAIIEVDGGITAENILSVYQAGARAFVAATAVYKFPAGIAAGVQALRRAVA